MKGLGRAWHRLQADFPTIPRDANTYRKRNGGKILPGRARMGEWKNSQLTGAPRAERWLES